MKKLKFNLLLLSFVLVSQFSYAQEEDINSAENKAFSNFDFIDNNNTSEGKANNRRVEFAGQSK